MPGPSPKNERNVCAACGGVGWIRVSDRPCSAVRLCECQIPARIRHVLPALYHGASLIAVPDPTKSIVVKWLEAVHAAIRKGDDPSAGLLLMGPTGTGKTFVACAIVRSLIESSRSVVFQSAGDFFEDLRATFNRTDITERSVLSRLADPEFLVLDDLGAGSLSDHERRSTLTLLDRRLNNLRPTIVTTNFPLDWIASSMDDRIASRLSVFRKVAITGRDRRAAK